MKVTKIEKEMYGEKYEGVEIVGCKFKTFSGAASKIEQYIGIGQVESWVAPKTGDDPEEYDYQYSDGSYAHRNGNEVDIVVKDGRGWSYSISFGVDLDGSIVYMTSIRKAI